MLHEVAITPSVFYPESYAHPGLCEAHMQGIRDALLEYLLVRDLRGGDWRTELLSRLEGMPNPAKQLIKTCITRGRLRVAPNAIKETPVDSFGWCNEALASHRSEPLSGILGCSKVKAAHSGEPLAASIEDRLAATWWQQCVVDSHPDGPRVRRNISAYLNRLGNILRYANHIIFADPHINPELPRYSQFVELLKTTARGAGPKALVEIHRVCYEDSGRNRTIVSKHEWQRRFSDALDADLTAVGVTAEVFIWDEDHDRHLISNLLGLHVGNGFDTSRNPSAVSTWTRLSSRERDAIQRYYDPQARSRGLYHRFKVGA